MERQILEGDVGVYQHGSGYIVVEIEGSPPHDLARAHLTLAQARWLHQQLGTVIRDWRPVQPEGEP